MSSPAQVVEDVLSYRDRYHSTTGHLLGVSCRPFLFRVNTIAAHFYITGRTGEVFIYTLRSTILHSEEYGFWCSGVGAATLDLCCIRQTCCIRSAAPHRVSELCVLFTLERAIRPLHFDFWVPRNVIVCLWPNSVTWGSPDVAI